MVPATLLAEVGAVCVRTPSAVLPLARRRLLELSAGGFRPCGGLKIRGARRPAFHFVVVASLRPSRRERALLMSAFVALPTAQFHVVVRRQGRCPKAPFFVMLSRPRKLPAGVT